MNQLTIWQSACAGLAIFLTIYMALFYSAHRHWGECIEMYQRLQKRADELEKDRDRYKNAWLDFAMPYADEQESAS